MSGLDWYLEQFLEYPSAPMANHAERIELALATWGRLAFAALFPESKGPNPERGAPELEIVSTDPAVLFWPWEALADRDGNVLAGRFRIHRSTRKPSPAVRQAGAAPAPRSNPLNVLLVTPRPEPNRIPYRVLAAPLIALAESADTPITMDILRPPTVESLAAVLAERPDHYHILHFDGHGKYAPRVERDHHGGYEAAGALAFENPNDYSAKSIWAPELAKLVAKAAVPAVVLNACQSAKHAPNAVDPFASVAAALLEGGVQSVLAMSYSISVRSARVFFGAFYRALSQSGSVSEAARCGRQALLEDDVHVSRHGEIHLKDWLIPVVYQHGEAKFAVVSEHESSFRNAGGSNIRVNSRSSSGDEIVGRDDQLLALERALQREPPGILVHGLAGIGKTALVEEFVDWMQRTGGGEKGSLRFDFHESSDVTSALNATTRALFGEAFPSDDLERSFSSVAERLRKERYIVFWDGLRCAPSSDDGAPAPHPERALLERLLDRLSGGKSKLLLTSRDSQGWLDSRNLIQHFLPPLEPEASARLAERILNQAEILPESENERIRRLLFELGGLPLLIIATLSRLSERASSAAEGENEDHALAWLEANERFERSGASPLPARSSAAQSVLDALRDGVDALPEECRPILIPLALHDTLVAAEHLERIAEVSGTGASAADAAHALASLTRSGLLAKADDGLYFVHPLLPIYVRSRVRPGGSAEEVERWIRTFVEFWAFEAQRIATADIPQASRVLARLEPTLLTARRIAGVHEMRREAITLIQALAGSAQDRHDFERALAFYAELVDEGRAAGDREVVAIAEHQLGMCHQQRGDLPSAEQHYLRSLEIKTDATNGADEARGDPARTKYQLGVLATEREDLATAERWFSEALDLASANNEDLVASALQAQAGLALRRNDLVRAENLYRRVEEIKKRSDKRAALGSLYHQYGRLEQQKGNREAAIRHYEAALAIAVEYHSPEGQAKALFQIGQIRRELGDLNEAESLVLKALEIEERFGMKENIAKSCHELGFIAQSRPDFARARLWFDRSLQIWNELRNTAEERAVLHHLGMIAIAKGDFDLAEEQLLSSLELAFQEKNAWAAATTCAELGQLNARQRQFAEAAHWVVRGLGLSRIASDRSLHDSLIQNFLAYYCRDEAEPERAAMDLEWQKTGLPPELPRGTLASTRRTAKLERAIEGMPDRDAEALLHRLLGDLDPPDPPRGQALRALVDELVEGVGRRPGEAPSTDGAIARNALKLLAIWPEHGERIRSLMDDSGTGAAVPRTLTGVRTNQLVVAVLGLAGIVTFDATKGAWRPTDRRRAGPEGLLAAFANQVINRDDRTFW